MGYDLHITRAAHWTDSDVHPIALAEWDAYVRSDPEMRLSGFVEAKPPTGEVLRQESDGIAVWTYAPDCTAWFYWNHGNIVVKNPDESVIQKMLIIAQHLRARVQGDDGELYPL